MNFFAFNHQNLMVTSLSKETSLLKYELLIQALSFFTWSY